MDVTKVQPSRVDERRTGFSLLLGITLWFIDLNTIYALPSLACNWNWFPATIAGIPGLLVVESIITLVAMLLMLFLIYIPFKNWRAYQSEKPEDSSQRFKDTEKDRRPLMAFVAMLLNSFFFLFIIAFLVPIISLKPCVTG